MIDQSSAHMPGDLGNPIMTLIIIIIVLLLLFGGGGGYYAHRSYGGRGLGGVLGLVVVVLILLAGALTQSRNSIAAPRAANDS